MEVGCGRNPAYSIVKQMQSDPMGACFGEKGIPAKQKSKP